MRAVDLIVKKREGQSLSREEIEFLINRYVEGQIPDYQMSSFAMAVFFRGMSFEETGWLTQAMIASGETMDLSEIPGPLVDKHSTGGVGDKVSLILAPLAAACGLKVPMMSGRGLGHTGGTLDKIESISGYRTDLSVEEFQRVLAKTGFAMIGQSEKIVPADRLLYALRDVTGTVESIPLITASIMSKKFAEGAKALVFDVKCGSGAFMKSFDEAEQLAEFLVNTGKSLGRKVNVLISDMDCPLGMMVGNFLEVREAIDCLQGRGPVDLKELVLRLTGFMLVLGGLAGTIKAAEELCRRRLEDGSAWEKFLQNVELQGGDKSVVLDPRKGPRAAQIVPFLAREGGFIRRIDAYRIGIATGLLGASRSRKEDSVFPEVGIELLKGKGEEIRPGDELCLIHGRERQQIESVFKLLDGAYVFSEQPVSIGSRILKEIVEV